MLAESFTKTIVVCIDHYIIITSRTNQYTSTLCYLIKNILLNTSQCLIASNSPHDLQLQFEQYNNSLLLKDRCFCIVIINHSMS